MKGKESYDETTKHEIDLYPLRYLFGSFSAFNLGRFGRFCAFCFQASSSYHSGRYNRRSSYKALPIGAVTGLK